VKHAGEITSSGEFRLELPGAGDRVLVVNCGSSSLKYALFDTADSSRDARGQVERIGTSAARHTHYASRGEQTSLLAGAGFPDAFEAMLEALTAPDHGTLPSTDDVSVVVHRVVHGGRDFTNASIIDDLTLERIDALELLAPLHNPAGAAGIRELQHRFPSVPHVAVFDTAFHHTMPDHARLYGLPHEYSEKGIRRYGFHGSSHSYVALAAAAFLGRDVKTLRLVSCHLGNGASLCAIDRGRSIDTTMGFTPAEGLVMGTRCGDLDTGVLAYLERTEGLTASGAEDLLNRRSGLLGMSGVSSDLPEVMAAAESGNRRARTAIDTFCYRIRKGIGAYLAVLGGADAVVFTGGIGQGSAAVRTRALESLGNFGIELDHARNEEANGFERSCRVSTDGSRVAVLVVPTDEERMMAREALQLLQS
jgi:acetate kinase